MRAGQLNQRITLQEKSVVKNSIGEDAVTWNDVATVWAAVIPLRGREFFAASQMQQVVDVRLRIRQRAGLAPDMRLQWQGEPYDIVGLIPGTDQYLGYVEIMAVKGVRNGR